MPRREQVDEVALELVRVLVFIHEDELEPPLVMLPHLGLLLQQPQPLREQVHSKSIEFVAFLRAA